MTGLTIELPIAQIVSVVLFVLGVVWGLLKIMGKQYERGLDKRFEAMELARAQADKHWNAKFAELGRAIQLEGDEVKRLEREFLMFQRDLPLHYVRREDYIRNQTVIEAKLDALAMRMENLQLKGVLK